VTEEGGGHYNTFRALAAVNAAFRSYAVSFDVCRKKRNAISYDRLDGVTGTETGQLSMEAAGFGEAVRSWLSIW
jgi:hypothetical protein